MYIINFLLVIMYEYVNIVKFLINLIQPIGQTKVKLTNPTTCLLKDVQGEDILGGFYDEELQKVKHSDIYLVEKVLRKKVKKLYVKWLGLNNTHNSWIDNSNIT
jgi:hypothetical protein